MSIRSGLTMLRTKGLGYTIRTVFFVIKKKLCLYLVLVLYRGERISFSQYREDLWIDMLLGYPSRGSYIDIGAHHPSFLSNTKKLYDRGWRGINVEPHPDNFLLFVKERPQDTNLNVGVSLHEGTMTYFDFTQSELSTFSPERAASLKKDGYVLVSEHKIKTLTLKSIFNQSRGGVDYMSVDVEGHALEVLQSNDWKKYRPRLICLEDDGDTRLKAYMKTCGYWMVLNNGTNSFYVDGSKYTSRYQIFRLIFSSSASALSGYRVASSTQKDQ